MILIDIMLLVIFISSIIVFYKAAIYILHEYRNALYLYDIENKVKSCQYITDNSTKIIDIEQVEKALVKANLYIIGRDDNNKRIVMRNSKIKIGRSKECEIVIKDRSVSREQCYIKKEGVSFVLHDIYSTNGTYVNGRKVMGKEKLEFGDIIKIGKHRIAFQGPDVMKYRIQQDRLFG